ncbi:MAG TPA: site-2 protease family protein [Acidobacteriaceae bacterium]|nr:site-2 protease family protein [Acidobacteriaceae bacterium]
MSGHTLSVLLPLIFKCALVLLCMLAHELGHILAARHFRVPVRKIGFSWMGMYIQRARTTGWPEISVCLAGATMNLLLALAFWNVSYWFALCNLVFGIVNLLPITNSDGSHALVALHAMQAEPVAVKQPTRIG